MSLKYRKKIKLFPGCTVNFSKSGISTTLGIKGLSINIGKRGTYLNTGIPGTGLYDRIKLNITNNNDDISNSKVDNLNYDVINNNIYLSIKSDVNNDITTDNMKEIKTQLLNAYNEKLSLYNNWQKAFKNRKHIRTTQILLEMIIIGFFMPSLDKELNDAISIEEQAWKEYSNFKYEFEFTTDENIDKLFSELSSKFDDLSKSNKIWDITNSRFTNSYRERTIAGSREVLRKEISLKKGQLEFIKSKYDALVFENANGGNIYLYPGFAIMYNGSIESSAFIDYPSFNISTNIINFTESEYVPQDAKQIGVSYRYVNKNGQPDKRYRYNPSYPVMAYCEYTLMSDKGLYEQFEFSNVANAIAFAEKYNDFINYLSKQSNENILLTMIENSTFFDNPENYLKEASEYAKLGFEALQVLEYDKADKLFNKAITKNNKDSISYLGKLLCEHKVPNINDLIKSIEIKRNADTISNNFDIGQSENFKKAKEIAFKQNNIEMFAGLYHMQLEAFYKALMDYHNKINNTENIDVNELKALKKGFDKLNEIFEYKDSKDKSDQIQYIIDEILNNNKNKSDNTLSENNTISTDKNYPQKSKLGDIVFLLPAFFLTFFIISNNINLSSYKYNYKVNQNNSIVSETIKNIDNTNQSNNNSNKNIENSNFNTKKVGWVQNGNDWYYFNEFGVMVVNDWKNVDGNTYYFNLDGKMLTNQWVGNKYVGVDGIMLRNTITPDGYYVGVNGEYIPMANILK